MQPCRNTRLLYKMATQDENTFLNLRFYRHFLFPCLLLEVLVNITTMVNADHSKSVPLLPSSYRTGLSTASLIFNNNSL